MDLAAQLHILAAAQGDPARLALASVDLAYPDLPEPERSALKKALAAAAIPHWCDEEILAALLGVSPAESAVRLARLRDLKVVEPFPARGEGAVNVHEASRLAIRKRMAMEEESRFRALSGRAVAFFEPDTKPSGRVEWIYHLLCAEPNRGADELETLQREWSSTAYPEDKYALATALRELEEQWLVQGRALLWSVLFCAWTRVGRGEAASLEEPARRALELSRVEADQSADAEAQMLLGDVQAAKGQLDAAREAHGACLEIWIRLAAEQPTNAGRQRDLAVAHSRVGVGLEAQGKLSEAQLSFGESLSIIRRLAEQDPTNAGWQWDLAVAHSKVGDVLEAQGKLSEAQLSFESDLAISRRLAEQDPTNAGWLRGLALALLRLGRRSLASGKAFEALPYFVEASEIYQHLVRAAPDNPGWAQESDWAAAELEACRASLADSPGNGP